MVPRGSNVRPYSQPHLDPNTLTLMMLEFDLPPEYRNIQGGLDYTHSCNITARRRRKPTEQRAHRGDSIKATNDS